MNDENAPTSLSLVLRHGLLELRNCDRVVRGYTLMLHRKRLGPLTELQEKAVAELERVNQKAARIMSQIERLLELEEPTASRWRRADKSIALGPLLGEAIGELDAAVLEAMGRLDIQADMADDTVTGDSETLKWALTRIVRFMGLMLLNGGGLSIRTVDPPDAPERWIVFAATENIGESIRHPRHSLTPFPDWHRGYLQFDVAFGGRIVRAYGGEILALPNDVGLVVALPRPGQRQDDDSHPN